MRSYIVSCPGIGTAAPFWDMPTTASLGDPFEIVLKYSKLHISPKLACELL